MSGTDMEPVAWLDDTGEWYEDGPVWNGKPVYSAEQIAALQAEIEELEHIRKNLLARNYKLEAESCVVSAFNKMIEKTVDSVQAELAERDKTILEQQAPVLKRFNEFSGGEERNSLERLRFFCSLAMNKQDWLDVEQFFKHIETQHEAALKAGRIKALEEAERHLALRALQVKFSDELHRTANELREQS